MYLFININYKIKIHLFKMYSTIMKTATYMIEESYLSNVAAFITVLDIRLLLALIGQNKKRYK